MPQASLGALQAAVAQDDRILIVLAGPNGAGKSTFFDIFLAPTGIRFVNADLIARAIDPDDSSSFAYYDEPYRLVAVFERGILIRRSTVLPAWSGSIPGFGSAT